MGIATYTAYHGHGHVTHFTIFGLRHIFGMGKLDVSNVVCKLIVVTILRDRIPHYGSRVVSTF